MQILNQIKSDVTSASLTHVKDYDAYRLERSSVQKTRRASALRAMTRRATCDVPLGTLMCVFFHALQCASKTHVFNVGLTSHVTKYGGAQYSVNNTSHVTIFRVIISDALISVFQFRHSIDTTVTK